MYECMCTYLCLNVFMYLSISMYECMYCIFADNRRLFRATGRGEDGANQRHHYIHAELGRRFIAKLDPLQTVWVDSSHSERVTQEGCDLTLTDNKWISIYFFKKKHFCTCITVNVRQAVRGEWIRSGYVCMYVREGTWKGPFGRQLG